MTASIKTSARGLRGRGSGLRLPTASAWKCGTIRPWSGRSSGIPAVLDVKVQPVPHPMFGVMAAVVLQGCQMPAPAGGPPM